jgi:hypothetical protein
MRQDEFTECEFIAIELSVAQRVLRDLNDEDNPVGESTKTFVIA